MNLNPMQLFQMLKGGGNPQNILMNMVKSQMGNNPMINNLIEMANKGDSNGVETFARNLLQQKGLDFDKEFKNFMGQFNN